MKMRNSLFALLGSLAVLAVSCQKEVDYQDLGGNNPGTGNPGTGNPSNNSIIGDWKFKKMIINIQTVGEVTMSGTSQKTVGKMNFATTNETGTLKIDATTLTASGVGYSVNSSMMMSMYVNGMLLSESPIPFQITQPPTDGSSPYTKIGTDSLVAESQLIKMDYPGIPDLTEPADIKHGLKVSWLGDTLVLTERVNQEMVDNSLGIPMKSVVNGTQTLKFTKN
jgi:hypothetical protein